MAKFDRYLLSQLMILFGFFALVLVMIYWINQAIRLFDQLIANGHSVLVFLEFSALTLPNVIRLVLPIAAFAASTYVGNRLASDSELVVVQSTGYSPFRLIRPVFVFSVFVAILISILTHVLVPTSLAKLAERRVEIQSNSTARLLQEGMFVHPSKGVTFYVKDISADGVLGSIFLADNRSDRESTSYSASRAMMVRSETGPKLIMFDGMAQTLRLDDQRLSTTRFSEFVFDIGALLNSTSSLRQNVSHLPTSVLLRPGPGDITNTSIKRATMLQAAHERISQALLAMVVSLSGFAAIMLGGFSRFGLWRQIVASLAFFLLLKAFDNVMNDLARQDVANWPLVYASSVVGFVVVLIVLWLTARPGAISRRLRRMRA